jgi:hypothetical protein
MSEFVVSPLQGSYGRQQGEMKPRSTECQCTYRFTCGYCLRNAKPYHYTLRDGSAIIPPPADFHPPRNEPTNGS